MENVFIQVVQVTQFFGTKMCETFLEVYGMYLGNLLFLPLVRSLRAGIIPRSLAKSRKRWDTEHLAEKKIRESKLRLSLVLSYRLFIPKNPKNYSKYYLPFTNPSLPKFIVF